jgi:hypothetical protein
MDTSSEDSEQRSLRFKLGLTRDGHDLDEFTMPQDDPDEDLLHHVTPTSTHEESDSSGRPRYVFTVGDNTNPGTNNLNPGTTDLNPARPDLPRGPRMRR